MKNYNYSLLAYFVIITLFTKYFSEAREFIVGGKENSWKIPSSPDEFNKWAEKNRFQIGDYIVLNYDPKSDSVLQVNQEDYNNCNKAQPIKSYQDGKTKILFDKSGPFYFISGANGPKLQVKVLSPQHSSSKDHFPVPAPAPASGISGIKVGIIGGFIVTLPSFIGLAWV